MPDIGRSTPGRTPRYGRHMPVTLHTWDSGDEPFLWEMLYASIHVAEGTPPPPRSVLDDPPIRHYLAGFGSRPGDDAVIACSDGVPIGAAFCRLFGADDPAYGQPTRRAGMTSASAWRTSRPELRRG